MTFHIRPYHTSDFNQVIHILQTNTPKYFAPEEEKDLIHYLQNQREDYFVIEEKNQIIGAGGINYKIDTAIISWDFILPNHHGKGIGSLLLNHRLKHIKNKELHQTIVRTSQFTYKFYEKHGFKLTETQKDFWGIGYDLYHMEMNTESLQPINTKSRIND